jgi:hypothetical protein
VVTAGAGLEYGFGLKGPRCGVIDAPRSQGRNHGGNGREIFAVIRPEIQAGTLPHPTSDGFKKVRLQEAVLMMAFLRPRIGKQNPEFVEGDAGGQRIDQLAGLGLDKVAVGEPGTLGLAFRA